jgi:hypothetical protein
MDRQIIVLAALCLGGCAATGPVADSGDTSIAASGAPAAATAPPAEASDGVIEALPAEQAVATGIVAQQAAATANPVVCRMERRTGSNRKVKVCHRAASAIEEAETRQTFDSLRRSQTQMGEQR